jgi:1-pyrroline-5-carboxylate dehydrogenase
MTFSVVHVPVPENEPVRGYEPGSPEKTSLKAKLKEMLSQKIEIPLIIGGKEIRGGTTSVAVCPHDHGHVLATYHQAGPKEIEEAVSAARNAAESWTTMPWEARASIFLKAAELLAGPWRDTVNAATMLNQSKTVHQAEIDAACEMIDFLRFNVAYMRSIYEQQPISTKGIWNYVEYRPLEGFVFAVTPFNFTSIAGNLPTAPAMMGNTILWKPASSAVLAAYYMLKLMQAAGLPDGVINFIPGRGGQVGNPVLANPELAGIHFTGSTATFQGMWRTVGENIENYKSYPRIVGETGGKDFIFAHATADPDTLVGALVRGAFEYQGQKCSAVSRAYIPSSIWPRVKDQLLEQIGEIRVGDPLDFRNFMCAVIDRAAYQSIMEYIDFARDAADAEILCGGTGDDSKGYFIQPTVVLAQNPRFKLMEEEIFGPVLTLYVYQDDRLDEALDLCDSTSPYALTGAVFAEDRKAIVEIAERLRNTAGNFYINDKPTGAVVGQQPFGGGRASGTNDKAGSVLNLLRWTSQRTIKENFLPPAHFGYPFMGEE